MIDFLYGVITGTVLFCGISLGVSVYAFKHPEVVMKRMMKMASKKLMMGSRKNPAA